MIVWWLLILYGVIGGLSLVALILIMVLGGLDLDVGGVDLDLDGSPDIDLDVGGGQGELGPFSIPIILTFTSSFGGLGAILTYMEVEAVFTPFISAGGAFLMSIVLFFVMQLVMKQFTSDSTVKISKQIGKIGSVTVPIYPGREGQITIFTDQRGRTLIPAVAEKYISNNTSVVIVGNMGDAVKVVPRSEYKRKPTRGPEKPKKSKMKERDLT